MVLSCLPELSAGFFSARCHRVNAHRIGRCGSSPCWKGIVTVADKLTPQAIHDDVRAILTQVKTGHPLVHCLTNNVVKQVTANALLAAGAAPAMVEDAV
ncbi:hypothetical protein DCC26_04605, partial [Auritidibacter sp. NML120779]